ncbi:S-layer homology domain-containing protein [Cohnella sp. LGH]|uniref:S-layer homology domain-containing protein n=1 Tax=Cohnella sp. LGH TaxID=1619153 RepID=UPI001AD9786F|nr:S-layer homology domain-containing protein [Cohnella sp. LGH]QTH42342.1 S-layer homology domain-containing protein [Cohnella sp. LGH]
MKKSLSILLSFALVFGLFASMASAADTELTVAQKYQALVDKGVLKGNPDGDARLDANLNRAEFATIAIAISGLAQEKPATATFSDVNSKQWWYGAIEAAAKAGLVEGYNGKFDPKANVTVEQVIKVAVQAAGLEIDEKAEAVEGASTWAAPYIKAALDAGLIATGLDYKADATRGQTILVGYSVYEKLNPTEPAKVSVVSAKAAGIKKVEVTLDKAVDIEKAAFALKKGSVNVTLDKVTWSEDKKVATLPLKDVKISEGEYTVTLSGVEDIATASASFKAEKEAVKSLEFVTASAEIAYTANAKVKVAAKNQYDELASFPASDYSVFTGYNGLGERITKDAEGYLLVVLNTNATAGTPATSILTQGVSPLPLTVYFNDTRVQVSKTFKIGNIPFVTKMEFGDVQYAGSKTSLTNASEVATIPVNLFDQYGNPITKDQSVTLSPSSFNGFITPQPNKLSVVTDDFDSDNTFESKVTLTQKEAKSGDYTLTVYVGGASDTATVKVSNAKVATKIGLGEFTGVIAEGDTAKQFYVPVLAYDVEGNELTVDEIVDPVNYARIKANVSGNVNAGSTLVQSGPNKGKILINGVTAAAQAKQVVFVSLSITEIDAQDYKTMTITIQDPRKPESLAVTGSSDPKAVLGANSDFTVKVRDQYGADLPIPTGYVVDVYFFNTDGTSGTLLKGRGTNAIGTAGVGATATAAAAVKQYAATENFNDGFTFDTKPGQYGKVQFKAELIKLGTGGASNTTISTAAQAIESIDPTKVDLTYTLKDMGNLFAVADSAYAAENAVTGNLHKKVGIAAKDSAGISVAFPGELVQNVTVSNGAIAEVGKETAGVTSEVPGVTAQNYYILGQKVGTVSVNATVYTAKGEVLNTTGTVTVKNDAVTVEKLTTDEGNKQTTAATHNAVDLMPGLKAVDNYGIEYTGASIDNYKNLIGITYSISNIKGGTVTLNASNQIGIGAGVTEFVLTAHAPNGKTVSVLVYL